MPRAKTKKDAAKAEKSGAETVVKRKPGRPKKVVPAPVSVEKPAKPSAPPAEGKKPKKGRYWQGVGRRKEAVAVVKMYTAGSELMINGKPFAEYFRIPEFQRIVDSPLRKMKLAGKFLVEAKVSGGGMRGQAEAVRLGISRALVAFNAEFRKRLRRAGYLTRDARVKERKKYGLKKARRAPQWQKR